LVGTTLNRVSVETFNPTINISVDELNKKFIEGYSLQLGLPKHIEVVNIVPDEVSVVKGEQKEILYSLDEDGQKIQNSYGIEGTKKEL
jgi:hypothetical protein